MTPAPDDRPRWALLIGINQYPDPSIRLDTAGPLWAALDEGRLNGVAVLDGRPRQLVAAPVMAPTLIGWVVVAADLDEREMRGLESLSAIPLHAAVTAAASPRLR